MNDSEQARNPPKRRFVRTLALATIGFWCVLLLQGTFHAASAFRLTSESPVPHEARRFAASIIWPDFLDLSLFVVPAVVLALFVRRTESRWAALGLALVSAAALWHYCLSGFRSLLTLPFDATLYLTYTGFLLSAAFWSYAFCSSHTERSV